MKTVGLQSKTRFRGPERWGWMMFTLAAAYNLGRMRNLAIAKAEPEICLDEGEMTP